MVFKYPCFSVHRRRLHCFFVFCKEASAFHASRTLVCRLQFCCNLSTWRCVSDSGTFLCHLCMLLTQDCYLHHFLMCVVQQAVCCSSSVPQMCYTIYTLHIILQKSTAGKMCWNSKWKVSTLLICPPLQYTAI